jgi:hypothetical protein
MRTVVLRGRGNFGARICRALAPRSDIAIIAMGLLSLPEFEPEFARWGITTTTRENAT